MSIQFMGLASGLDTRSIVQDLMKVERQKVEKVEKNKTLATWERDVWKEVNSKIYNFHRESVFKLRSASTYLQKSVQSSDPSKVKVSGSPSAVNGNHTLTNVIMAKGSTLSGDKISVDKDGNPIEIKSTTKLGDLYDFEGSSLNIDISLDGGATVTTFNFTEDDTITDFLSKIRQENLDLNINYDSNFSRFFISSKNTGQNVKIKLEGENAKADELLGALGFGTVKEGNQGVDAQFEYNGTVLTSEKNEFTLNGMSITLQGDVSQVNISVSSDVDGIYNSVKDFVLKYNELMMDIEKLLNAESARGYEPLTSEEKKAMGEDDVKLWEDRIRSSLLRRNDTLTTISRSIRSIVTLSSGVNTGGFMFKSISSLGIVTGDYTERGILHIEGDSEGIAFSEKENKLRKAIEDNPEEVLNFMTELGRTLYDDMSERMKSTSLRSALTFYNDKALDRRIKQYDTNINNLEKRLSQMEERYFKQFTAMEKAIQKANATSNWLMQQLGGN